MEKQRKEILIRYLTCFGVGVVILFIVFAMKGFFTDNAKANLQILTDAFFVAGMFFLIFAALSYVSGEGAFLGIGYALGMAVKALIPFMRKEQETYAEYRERKTGKEKKKGDGCFLFTGLFYVLISMIFLIIWYQL